MRGVLIAIDQLGNAIAGGNPDATISARTGYFSRVAGSAFKPYWVAMARVIDFTFLPIEGADHCYRAYLADRDEEHQEGSDFMRGLLGVIIVCSCIPLSLVTRIYAAVFLRARRSES